MSADPQDAQSAPAGDAPRDRRESMSQRSEASQTAADFIRDQMQLEADAREALPYSISECTKPLGSLRQNVFACLTCNPPPANPSDPFTPAGVCYSCSVQCHGEHELVEIFQKRNFTCDCGTTRFTKDQPCTLRLDPDTNTKGAVHSEPADPNNRYNQNFRNRFCSCSIDYKAQEQKGTMFQCLGLGTADQGGCGEDWYHPGCLAGLGPRWWDTPEKQKAPTTSAPSGGLPSIAEDDTPQQPAAVEQNASAAPEDDDDDPPLPQGFPGEDDFDHFICYKCIEANPWIKRYAGCLSGFLAPVYFKKPDDDAATAKKRPRDDEDDGNTEDTRTKRIKSEPPQEAQDPSISSATDSVPIKVKEEDSKDALATSPTATCKLDSLPPTPSGQFSLFVKEGFRDQFCRCPACFPNLKPHPQLLDEEEAYEPPLSDTASDNGSTHGSGSLYERGESALRNVDRVRAIEGVMAYNHLKEQLTPFFKRFAESGEAVSAEHIKEYFAKLRGDQEAIQEAGEAAKSDSRHEQSGY
ncbi:hypothetical protein JX265_002226 [Neoarthrinium moseri]|uniref:UBR-type domain-containing protein n=1 Tax=Neoarthrinium moseri TaxID=1658444 RepID=A0A9P9WUJ1_9PEZI|nr:hypothetical protein JX266_004186 [Neoarthrinium moseri]KAI1879272.1 hypothetical protein JX265_002226 [Neoarthrinium moseri]